MENFFYDNTRMEIAYCPSSIWCTILQLGVLLPPLISSRGLWAQAPVGQKPNLLLCLFIGEAAQGFMCSDKYILSGIAEVFAKHILKTWTLVLPQATPWPDAESNQGNSSVSLQLHHFHLLPTQCSLYYNRNLNCQKSQRFWAKKQYI